MSWQEVGQSGVTGYYSTPEAIRDRDNFIRDQLDSFSKGWPPLTEAEQIRARLNKRLRGNKWPNNTKGTP